MLSFVEDMFAVGISYVALQHPLAGVDGLGGRADGDRDVGRRSSEPFGADSRRGRDRQLPSRMTRHDSISNVTSPIVSRV